MLIIICTLPKIFPIEPTIFITIIINLRITIYNNLTYNYLIFNTINYIGIKNSLDIHLKFDTIIFVLRISLSTNRNSKWQQWAFNSIHDIRI